MILWFLVAKSKRRMKAKAKAKTTTSKRKVDSQCKPNSFVSLLTSILFVKQRR